MKDLEIPLPSFPPKKFFPLTIHQQEDRRLSLDKYIQTIGQNTNINNSELLNGFLLSAQLESAAGSIEDNNIDIFLLNGTKINLDVTIAENSGQILKVKLNQGINFYYIRYMILNTDYHYRKYVRELN
jgi:sorting nexin-17